MSKRHDGPPGKLTDTHGPGDPIVAVISARPAAGLSRKRILRRPVPGGLINEYERAA